MNKSIQGVKSKQLKNIGANVADYSNMKRLKMEVFLFVGYNTKLVDINSLDFNICQWQVSVMLVSIFYADQGQCALC